VSVAASPSHKHGHHNVCLLPQILDANMSVAEGFGQQALSQLDSQIAEVEDMLSYCNDVFNTGETAVAVAVAAAAALAACC